MAIYAAWLQEPGIGIFCINSCPDLTETLPLRYKANQPGYKNSRLTEMIYEPIKDNSDLDKLRLGDILIQYPLVGGPAEKIDTSIPEDYALYQLTLLSPLKLRLLLRTDLPLPGSLPEFLSEEQIARSHAIFIEKQTSAIVCEKTWWRLGSKRGYKFIFQTPL